MEIRFNNISRHFGAISAIKDFSLIIPPQKLVVVVGPSGSGKSTLLALLTGLLAPSEGEIYIDEKLASSRQRILIPPRKRQIGMVFQTLALWPHMTVKKNLQFVLKGKCPKKEITNRINEILTLTDIKHYVDTYPAHLSGGEQQRVALARALVIKPRILLFDEPLSNLDKHLVKKLLPLIRKFHHEFATTTIYVTHDQSEALNLADLVAVVQNGRLIQVNTPKTIYQQPTNKFVASFIGEATLLEGELLKPDLVKTSLGEFKCIINEAISDKKICVLIRPENLQPHPQGNIKGKITAIEFKGENWFATITTADNIPLYATLYTEPQINTSISLSIINPVWIIPDR
jgi:iron(III) transport system ATP-binding protein